MNAIDVSAPFHVVRALLLDPAIVLRLNPSWFVKEIKPTENGSYSVTLYDDRADDVSEIALTVREGRDSIHYAMNATAIEFVVFEASPAGIRLSIAGNAFREEDLPYWLKGLKNYIQLESKQSRAMKWILDRVWLRMTPSQRRIAIIILLAEGIGFAALIVVIIALKFL